MTTLAQRQHLSGYCNPSLPRTPEYDPHQRCKGCDCKATGCPCSPTVAPTPTQAVQDAQNAADTLNTALLGYNPPDWRDALRLLHQLRKVTQTLGALDASLVKHLYLHGEHGHHQTLDGIGEYGIGRGREKERWSGPEAINDYVERKVQAIDGEYPDPATVVEWVLEVLPATPSVSLRVTPLKEMGLDVNEYRSSEPGTLRVDLPKHELT